MFSSMPTPGAVLWSLLSLLGLATAFLLPQLSLLFVVLFSMVFTAGVIVFCSVVLALRAMGVPVLRRSS
jgi:hypothetical protein